MATLRRSARGALPPISRLAAAAVFACLVFDQVATRAALEDVESVVTVSGSGTTNPSPLLWRVFDTIEQRAGSPVRITYRAVGSGTGIREFVGNSASAFEPYSNFGSADIPLPSSEWSNLVAKGKTPLQIPFVLGAVSFFHTVKAGPGGLKLSPCLLAKIFLRQITTWDDPDILAENPDLKVDPGSPITVLRRTDGSSSTSGITAYLSKACPEVWGSNLVGSTIEWPAGTSGHQGSGGITEGMQSTAMAITYLSSGHGHDAGLAEVQIMNLDGNYLTWLGADVKAALLEAEGLPQDYTEDLSNIDLIHLRGPDTWPITQLSYLFIRVDQTRLPQTGALLKAVAKMLFSPEVQDELFPIYGFTALPAEKIDLALSNIDKIQLASNSPEWIIETSTQSIVGQGPTTISSNRKSWVEEELESLSSTMSVVTDSLGKNLGRSVHGSGTTNPSGLLWHVMEILMDRAPINVDLSYRAVGSSTGQVEFIGADNGYVPYNDFGSGDLPLSAAQYQELNGAGHPVIQIPFLIGAVGVFHDIPSEIVGRQGLSLDSCLLARIFQANITSWDHPDILAQNPEMTGKVSSSDKITAFRRDLGSSSTAGFTSYIKKACPDVWRLGSGTQLNTWPAEIIAVQGSQGMVDAISETPFSIGYVDSGFGWNNNLQELALRNRDGTSVTTKTADVQYAAKAAVDSGMIPTSARSDFSGVDLLDQPGERTWPITLFSYIYARQDLKHLGNSAGVLKAMLQFLHSDEVQEMFSDFGFFPPPSKVVDLNLRGIDELILPPGTETWAFESPDKTIVGGGADRFVFSGKRHSFTRYQAQLLANRVEEIEATTGLSASGAASDASKPIYLELEELKEQNARLQIISIIAIILAVLSIMVSISLMIFMMCRNMAASGSPCPNPAMAHLPMKDNGNGQGAEVEDVKVET